MDLMGRLTLAADCDGCGFTTAVQTDSGLRCVDCGRFASVDTDACCIRHEVRDSPYPSGMCPRCEQERNRQAQREHMVTRDRTMEPY